MFFVLIIFYQDFICFLLFIIDIIQVRSRTNLNFLLNIINYIIQVSSSTYTMPTLILCIYFYIIQVSSRMPPTPRVKRDLN